MKFKFSILLLVISINLLGQTLSKKELRYIPENFDESLKQLEKITPDSTKARIRTMIEDDFVIKTHFSTGLGIRNNWLYNRYLLGLIVTKSDLRKDLMSKGLYQNDDMSSVILRSFYRKLNNKEILLPQQIKDVNQFYINMNNPIWRAKQDSINWKIYMQKFQIGDTVYSDVYYDRNWLGKPRANSLVKAIVIEKSFNRLKIEIYTYGADFDQDIIKKEIKCDSSICWINPYLWKKRVDFLKDN
jgi:hypothetical protein